MINVALYGFPLSTYVRTARIALAEKGVTYELFPFEPNTPDMQAVNPTGKVPAFKHGDFTLYETLAITNYIDDAFDGPALQPSDAKQRAVMNQWISYINAYVFPVMVHEIVLFRFEILPMDQSVIDAAIPKANEQLALLEKTLNNSDYLAGDSACLADYFLYPILAYMGMVPEASLLADYPSVSAWKARMEEKSSVTGSAPAL
ncbi:MAG: glutathione S-transferase family protein [Cycloclasticus sp.]|nr:glutathione S-transferase family protein [Cycloclasticus sp.]